MRGATRNKNGQHDFSVLSVFLCRERPPLLLSGGESKRSEPQPPIEGLRLGVA